MEIVWFLIFTIEHGTAGVQSHMKQIVIPHEYQSEEACNQASRAMMDADIEKKHRVFSFHPWLPNGKSYNQEYGLWIDCLAVPVDK